MAESQKTSEDKATYQKVGLLLGPAVFLLIAILPAPGDLSQSAWFTAAVATWMAIWWSTEAVHVAVTALLPLVVFAPLGILPIKAAAAPYANPTIYLFLGGFIIAAALQKADLHRRIAYFILSYVSRSARSIILGFMIVSALLSMWMTNTSTTMMLLPIALSIVSTLDGETGNFSARERKHFQIALLLGIAYAATIGGMSTLVGTPPNAFLVGFMSETYGVQLDFAKWMLIGIPLSVTLLPIAWIVLTRWIYPVSFVTPSSARSELEQQRKALGPIRSEEWRVGIVFALVAMAWMTRPLFARWLNIDGVSDAGIAMLAAVSLFIIPNGKSTGSLMEWSNMKDIPWGILILFGGGLSLAAAVSTSGLAQWLGEGLLNIDAFGVVILVLCATTLVIFLTELTSNLATAATFLPVVAVIALEMGGTPMTLILPVTLAASCAFMLPVATPPNAIVFSSGYISIPQMVKAGFMLNLISIVLVTAIAVWLAPLVF
ncbi:SLC13/DASS family transporter [Alteromonas pelagimontana]|uniref:SLC13/DASS family transporter n=1 Tax=Alteromonas pelagimontana TaxID=1858656 RepID=A0A6M4MI50_9ALTE|nr:SLC13 family permease [Alteromonas pelagimontana]QJR82864.1 SLC13/DASS family transporter [Alteromonas pelagimontana]